MSKSVVIIGASGHGKVIADIILKSGDCVKGFLDDSKKEKELIAGVPVLGKVDAYEMYPECYFVVAIGNVEVRERIAETLTGKVRWYTAIHPTAVISGIDVEIGEGTVVMANAVINSAAKVGKHCIINTASVVEHDNNIEDYVHISPNATLAGTVCVGKRTHIGAGAVVKNNINISKDCVIGIGAAVVKDIEKPGVFVGIPAKKIRG